MSGKINPFIKNAFFSISLFLFAVSQLPVQASGTAQVLEASQFKKEYLGLCLSMTGLKKLSQKKRSQYCDCMLSQYQKRKYTTTADLQVIKQMYTDLPQEKKKSKSEEDTLLEETLNHFEQEMAEECLSR